MTGKMATDLSDGFYPTTQKAINGNTPPDLAFWEGWQARNRLDIITIYVVTESGHHADVVRGAFLSEQEARQYCAENECFHMTKTQLKL